MAETAPDDPYEGPDPTDADASPRGADEPSVKLHTQLNRSDHVRLRYLSIRTGKSLQTLGIEAWSLLLNHYGEDGVFPRKANGPSGMKKPRRGARDRE